MEKKTSISSKLCGVRWADPPEMLKLAYAGKEYYDTIKIQSKDDVHDHLFEGEPFEGLVGIQSWMVQGW